MYIMTGNGWVALWELSAPKNETPPVWGSRGRGWDAVTLAEDNAERAAFEAEQQAKLDALRAARRERGLI